MSEEVVEELRRSVEKREQSCFVETALQKGLERLQNSGGTLLNY